MVAVVIVGSVEVVVVVGLVGAVEVEEGEGKKKLGCSCTMEYHSAMKSMS